ncbi:AhpC/TSA family protein [Sneathiella marina]|uniref:AhpC/TSA family protein n=1 Tax=Sneathiella marina TaxID=2950108 RepID=A0ABY4W3Z1_9PROT|nr:peroxiredoxin-like family protein [Sneathiella marina]USG60833.1 AhpC/TSA family protein [Sneathiella marina]
MNTEKLAPGSIFPEIIVPTVAGGQVTLGKTGTENESWQLVVVYRGKHCPICMRYLTTLGELESSFAEQNVEIVAVSGDGIAKAKAQVEEGGIKFPVGYDLKPEQMETLGLYISDPRSPEETDQPFPEPGLFVIRPDGQIQIIDISNAPFARPDLNSILKGITFIREKGYPIRGRH